MLHVAITVAMVGFNIIMYTFYYTYMTSGSISTIVLSPLSHAINMLFYRFQYGE